MHLKYVEMEAIVVHENMKLVDNKPIKIMRGSHEISDKIKAN